MKLPSIARAWTRARTRLGPPPEKEEERGTLCLSVCELGWQTTLQFPDEPDQANAESWSDADASVPPAEAIRRAVRTLSRAQRERIGAVRLMVSDPAIFLIDSRSARIRSADEAAIMQVGCYELGVKAALYSFVPFGQSSEYEMARAAYAFLSVEQAKEYLIALDSLASRLIELVPAPLLELAEAQTEAWATFELRSTGATLMLADPNTGIVLSRELDCGRGQFVAAVVEATAVSSREAIEGLQRRVCFQKEAGWLDAPPPMTATERALSKLLTGLKTEFGEWLEHFVHHRLANPPARVVLQGEVERVRGLSEWIAHAIGTPAVGGVDGHRRFVDTPGIAGRNLLEMAPAGMLTLGKTEYHFVDGRFRSHQPASGRADQSRLQHFGRLALRRPLGLKDQRKLALPAAAAVALGTALWLGAGMIDFKSPMDEALGTLAAAQAADGVLRQKLLAQPHLAPAAEPVLPWFDKLVAIAHAAPTGIRVVKIAASGADPAVDDKLVLEGEALADNNLAGISTMIDRLASTSSFMRGVGAITFGGAQMGEHGANGMLSFTINMSLTPRSGNGRPAPPGRRS